MVFGTNYFGIDSVYFELRLVALEANKMCTVEMLALCI